MAEEKKSQSSLEHEEDQEADESPPLKVARLPSDEAGIVTMAAPSPLMLGLGLGQGRGLGGASKPAFTFMQLQELEHHALIFKYMAAGLPVPVHLVVPIWKSIAASSFGSYHYPSFMGYGSLCLDYRNSMEPEPEPGRCRRTDGKKWRCSEDVVPDQKYCERHMHRGRNRPRKPVEGVGPTAATSRSCGTQLSISVSSGGREAIDSSVGTSGSGGRVSSPELGLSHSGSARKTVTFNSFRRPRPRQREARKAGGDRAGTRRRQAGQSSRSGKRTARKAEDDGLMVKQNLSENFNHTSSRF